MRDAITKNDAGLNRSKAVPSRLCKQNGPMTVDRQMRLISTHVTLYHVNLPGQPLVSAIAKFMRSRAADCRLYGSNTLGNSCNGHFDD